MIELEGYGVRINPFTKEYFFEQFKKYKFKDVVKGNVVVKHVDVPFGIHNCFLNRDMFELNDVPALYIDGEIMMSLTPLEIESHYMPIELAEGRVGVAGLGLGYFVQNVLEKETVDEVIVYELNQNVIDIYLDNFGEHEKLTIVNKDVFKVKGEHFDFFYNDIYQMCMTEKAFEDVAIICKNNDVDIYHWWAMEGFIQSAIHTINADSPSVTALTKVIPVDWLIRYLPFIALLEDTRGGLCENNLIPKDSYELFEKYKFTKLF